MVGHDNMTSDHVHRNYDHGFECKQTLIINTFDFKLPLYFSIHHIFYFLFVIADITAEQLFNMFFNGAFPTRPGPMTNPYYTRSSFSRRWPPESDNDNHQQQVTYSLK